MCHLWATKIMACGHVQEGWKFQACETFDALATCYEICVHGSNEPGPYRLGDPDCLECALRAASRDVMDDLWNQAVVTAIDDYNHTRVENARTYILSLDYLDWTDIFIVHQNLMKQYIENGSVMDVDFALEQLGCYTPSMLDPFQPGRKVVMTKEEEERFKVEQEWEELSGVSSDSEMDENSHDKDIFFESAKNNQKEVVDDHDSADDHGFWEAMEIDNDVGSVLHRLEEEMGSW